MRGLVINLTILLVFLTCLLLPAQANPPRDGDEAAFDEDEIAFFRERPDSGNRRGNNGRWDHNRERGPAGRVDRDQEMPMPTPATDDMSMDQIMKYFEKYHYMGENQPDTKIGELVIHNMSMAIHEATKIFQKRYVRYGLRETGELDEDTIALMMKPRCGVADILSMNDMTKRNKRFVTAGNKWRKELLTYQITQYPQDGDLSQRQVDREIRRAFAVWEEVTPLRFLKLEFRDRTQVADIDIRFVKPYSNHGDGRGNAFDGPGGTLAHAFFPQNGPIGGDTHFDDSEIWTLTTPPGSRRGDFNLFQVAAHEFGHALGLDHSRDPSALMAPFYGGYIKNFVLPLDDVMGIQTLYGGPARPTSRPNTPDSNICRQASFDAITTILVNSKHKTYGFKGKHYFLIDERTGGIANGYPRLISQGWPGLPNKIDAALFWDEGKDWVWDPQAQRWKRDPAITYVFKGNLYWEVGDMSVISGPKRISDWGLPRNIDAAFVWRRNGKTYFFKGNKYYKYTRGVGLESGYPRSSSVWGLPNNIDAAFQYANGLTYFFKDNQFYEYDDANLKVQSGFPRDNYDHWFRC